jgi:hypothetical protein
MQKPCDCNQYKSSGTLKKSSQLGLVRKTATPQDVHFAQIVHTECKKAFHTAFKKAAQGKKHFDCHEKSDSDSDSDF